MKEVKKVGWFVVCSFVVREKEHKRTGPYIHLLKEIKGSTDLFYLISNPNFIKFIQNL